MSPVQSRRTAVCPPDHKHAATQTCYHSHGCGCRPCLDASVKADRDRRRQIAYGRWDGGRVPVATVAEKLAELQRHGFSLQAISKAAGVSPNTTHLREKAYVWGPQAAAILALTPEALLADDRLYISARGSQRRIRALATKGWTQVYIASRLGITQPHISTIFVDRRTPTYRHRAIAELFDELWNVEAPRGTRFERAAHARVTRHAARLGWLPPLAWDDIDLDDEPAPLGEADTEVVDEIAVALAISGEPVPLTQADRREAVTRLHALYLNDTAIAARLYCASATVLRDRQELGLPAAVGADKMPLAS